MPSKRDRWLVHESFQAGGLKFTMMLLTKIVNSVHELYHLDQHQERLVRILHERIPGLNLLLSNDTETYETSLNLGSTPRSQHRRFRT